MIGLIVGSRMRIRTLIIGWLWWVLLDMMLVVVLIVLLQVVRWCRSTRVQRLIDTCDCLLRHISVLDRGANNTTSLVLLQLLSITLQLLLLLALNLKVIIRDSVDVEGLRLRLFFLTGALTKGSVATLLAAHLSK